MIITPEAKLESEPCNAKPTARPAAPSTAINEVVCTPSCPSAASATKTISAVYAMFTVNVTST